MTEHPSSDQNPSAAEERELALVGERLERSRPLPNPTFRGDLRRYLLGSSRREGVATSDRFRLWATGYTVAGAACLAVAAVGLVGVGPFAT